MIAVLGATGRVGSEVARLLAARGADARALVRRPESADVALPAVRADLAEPESLTAALNGVDRLFLLTPHVPEQEQLEAAAVAAAAAAGVRHIVKVSGSAASLGPNGVTPTAIAHWRSEQRIEASGLGFTFLRPSFFQQNLLESVAPVVAEMGILAAPLGHAPIVMVDVRDIAAAAVAVLLDPEPGDRAWQLTGPRPVSFDDIARALGVRYLAIPARVAERGMLRRGADRAEIAHTLRMAAYFSAGADAHVTDHVERLTGRPPRAVEDLLAEHRDAFAPTTTLSRTLSLSGRKEPR